jgi:hypothetical protein
VALPHNDAFSTLPACAAEQLEVAADSRLSGDEGCGGQGLSSAFLAWQHIATTLPHAEQ